MRSGRRKTLRWAKTQARDPWVRRARAQGLPSRSAFKLEEIAARYRFLRQGQRVLELGAAPGGWTRIAVVLVGPRGRVVAVDRSPMVAPEGAVPVRGDLRDAAVLTAALDALGGPADVVLSDLAPNLTGIRDVDAAGEAELGALAAEVAGRCLKQGGTCLVKVFSGAGSRALEARLRRDYRTVRAIKPAASRARSSEFYLLAQGLCSAAGHGEGVEGGL